jgi:hypothetical protein
MVNNAGLNLIKTKNPQQKTDAGSANYVIRQINAVYANRFESGHHQRVVFDKLRFMGHEIMPRYRQCQSIFCVIFAVAIA